MDWFIKAFIRASLLWFAPGIMAWSGHRRGTQLGSLPSRPRAHDGRAVPDNACVRRRVSVAPKTVLTCPQERYPKLS